MFDIDTCVAFITNNAAKDMENFFNERLIPLGATRVQWFALYYLGKYDAISQSNLAKKMNLKNSTVVRLIDRMERDGYVKRVKDLNDRRITTLILTQEGIKLRQELLPEGEKVSKIFSRNITDEELETFMNVLSKMVNNIKE